ncbi:MAG: exosortase system-associated protein, TIGR04073 family [Acidobacteriota bacterium]
MTCKQQNGFVNFAAGKIRVRRRLRFSGIGAVALLILVLLSTMFAPPVSAETAGDKALRGLANILTGVMAFPGEIYETWKKDGAAVGLTAGTARGLGMIVARELVGVFELLTSPVPWPDAGYRPILKPAYTWEYFQQ